MNGGEWCENGAEPGKLRRCIAHEMKHGAPKWRARRDRRVRDGGKRFSRGFYAVCQKDNPENPRSATLNAFPRVSHLSGRYQPAQPCNRPIALYESTTSLVYNSRTEMSITLRAVRR